MDILRRNLDLVVGNLESILSKTDGKQDGPIIDTLRLAESCLDMAKTMKGARRWIAIEERQPTESGTYETVMERRGERTVLYNHFNNASETWANGDVLYWRKQPRFPRN